MAAPDPPPDPQIHRAAGSAAEYEGGDFTLRGFLWAERYILTGLGCAVLLLSCLFLGFFVLWRQFPPGGSPAQRQELTPDPTRQQGTNTSPATPNATQTPIADPATPVASPVPPDVSGRIAYVCYLDGFDQICLMGADGSGQTRLTANPATDFYPSLAADGSAIVFSSRRDGRFEIYELDLESGNQRRLTDQIGSAFAPEISPDGRLIAFTNTNGDTQSIWIMNRDGTDPKPLAGDQGDAIDPTWSPDGQYIAFASNRNGQGTQLYTIELATRAIRQVTLDVIGIGGRSDWSPDGTTLAFYAGPPEAREIFLINIDGSNLRQVTSGGDNLAPSFSPDGNWIAFTSYRTGNNEIFRMRVDGQQVVQLTNNDHPDWQPRWGP